MDCAKVRHLLHRYADGELDAATASKIDTHVAACRGCTAALGRMQRVVDASEAVLTNEPTPEGFNDAVLQAIARAGSTPAPRRGRAWWNEAAMAARKAAPWWGHHQRALLRSGAWATGLALVATTLYAWMAPGLVSPRQTLVLGQDRLAWDGQAAFRVVALQDKGTPLVNTPVAVEARRQSGGGWQTLYAGLTNQRGTVDAKFTLPPDLEGRCELKVAAGSWPARDVVVQPIAIERRARVLLTTDKPLYQPGQVIHTRVLALLNGSKKAAAAQACRLEIKDPKGNRVFRQELRTSKWGIAAADFQLADEVNQGAYHLTATMGDDESEKTVTVKPYVLPKFRVDAATSRSYYAPGDRLQGTVNARYFFGKAVAGGQVKVELAAYDTAFHGFATFHGATDSRGQFSFATRLPTSFAGQPLQRGEALVRLGVRVRDRSGHEEQLSQTVPVAAQPFAVALVPESGEPAWGLENIFYVVTSYPDGTVARTQGQVSLGAAALPFTTDEAGIGAVKMTVPTDSFSCNIEATDSAGRTASKVESFERADVLALTRMSDHALAQVGYRGAGAEDGVLLRPDRALYRVGDTLKLEVLARRPTGTLYLDIARDGQTVLTRSMEAKDGRARLAVDLGDDLAGTLTLHAYYLNEQLGMVRDTRTVIVQAANNVRVALEPSKATFRPGEQGKVHIRLANAAGKPVAGAVGLSAVDESVFAKRDAEPGLEHDYFNLENAIMTPRYQEKFALPPSFYPTAAIHAAAADRRAEVALACLDGPKNFRLVLPQVFQAGMRRLSASYSLDIGDADYGLWVESLAQRQAAAQSFHDRYCRGLFSILLLSAMIFPLYCFVSARSWMFIPWLPVMGLIYLLTSVDTSSQENARIAQVMLALGALALGAVARWGRTGLAEATVSVCVLLVVGVAIFPMFARARENARRSTPFSTMRQVALAQQQAEMDKQEPAASHRQPPHLRQFFPETLFWQPEVITDDKGEADVAVPMADSITTWRLSALASTVDGEVGSATTGLRVFQDFFIDPDLPQSLTQGDWVAIPVAIHNYLPRPQKVRISLKPAAWFSVSGKTSQEITLAANDVGVVRFPITAMQWGGQALEFEAQSPTLADAVKREVEVAPRGEKLTTTVGDRLQGDAMHTVAAPAGAIDGTSRLWLKLYPGTFSQVVAGLDGLLRIPYGCFEQTSSITYPNVLILDYLKRTGKATPEAQMKASQFISMGYQRILTFETPGGGFDWFGSPPAKTVLSAYGLMELTDMAHVATVDEGLIKRARAVLLQRQQGDGSWPLDIRMHTWTGIEDPLPLTAYVAWSLGYAAHAEHRAPDEATRNAIDAALVYLEPRLNATTDPYVLALAANAFAVARPQGAFTTRLLGWLDAAKTVSDHAASWTARQPTLTYGGGGSASVETTAFAAQAFLRAQSHAGTATAALTYLIRQRDGTGAWGTTQATILALQSLLLAAEGAAEKGTGKVTVQIDGRDATTLQINDGNYDVMQQVDLSRWLGPGRAPHRVTLSKQGSVEPLYQIVMESYVPWRTAATLKPRVAIGVAYDRTTLAQNDIVTANVSIQSHAAQTIAMLIADVGLAPGFTPDAAALTNLVKAGRIAKFEVTPRQLIFYLRDLAPGQTLRLPVHLRARFPVRAIAPPAAVYEYYNPQQRATAPAVSFTARA